MQAESTPGSKQQDRWIVIRDMLVFQFKLVVDGILDLVLLPVSLVVGLISFTGRGPKSGTEFYALMRMGRRGERWINLFGAVERRRGSAEEDEDFAAKDLDALVSRVESFLIDEDRKRGVTAQTRQRLDAALDSLQSLSKREKRNRPD